MALWFFCAVENFPVLVYGEVVVVSLSRCCFNVDGFNIAII